MNEARRRERARDEAVASTRLEGLEVGSQTREDLDSYARGEMSLDEMEKRVLARYSRHQSSLGHE